MKCPICDSETKNSKKCTVCSFDQIRSEFLTEEDYRHWLEDTVNPCRTIYKKQLEEIAILNTTITILKIENEKLKKSQIASGKTLYDFFKNNGFEVIDKRLSGGCLWVVSSKAELDPYINVAKNIFNLDDNGFSSGRATANRTGWYTKSKD